MNTKRKLYVVRAALSLLTVLGLILLTSGMPIPVRAACDNPETPGNDTITCDDENDSVDAGDGSDTVFGGGGDDFINGHGGGDELHGGEGNDEIMGGADGSGDQLYGEDGDDYLNGEAGTDQLFGGPGNDHLEGGAGADEIHGGSEWDTVDYSQSAGAVDVDLGSTDPQAGGDAQGDTFPDSDIEGLIGSSGDDTLTGSPADNWIEGGPGADAIDGADGWDNVGYGGSADPVNVDLATGTLTGGDAEGDTLVQIEGVSGSQGNDTLTGDAGENWFEGLGGADTIDGGDGFDNTDYSGSPAAVVVDLAAGTGSGGDAEGDTLSNIEGIIGSEHADTLTGDAGDNPFDGHAGADTIDGGDGMDNVDYFWSEAPVDVNLATGQGSGGHAEGDTYVSIEGVNGSPHDDTLTGDAGDNWLEGGPGADAIDGGAGNDSAQYTFSEAPVTVNLATGVNTGGDAEGDILTHIENLVGSQGNDILTGDAGDNWLTGGAGADVLDGGAGEDWAIYAWSNSAAVNVDLAAGTTVGGDATGDTLSNIEGVVGTRHADTLTGDAGNNLLFGNQGDDILAGGAGDDVLGGGLGTDIIDGGLGADNLILSGLQENDDISGGGGDDVYVFDSTSPWAFSPVTGAATLRASSGTLDFSLFGFAVNIDLGLQNVAQNVGNNLFLTLVGDFLNVIGSPFGDTIIGNGQANDLWGGDGDDTLDGGLGVDFLDGGAGNDSVLNYQAADAHIRIENGQPEVQAPVPEGAAPVVLFENGDLSVVVSAQGELTFTWQGTPLATLAVEQWSTAAAGTVLLNVPYPAQGILLRITMLGSGQFLIQHYSLVDGTLMESTIITP
jgi:Ca2+-binding RTX toxin-like protein